MAAIKAGRWGFDVILFLRVCDIGIDSKIRRYCRALRLNAIDHMALFWDRDGTAKGDSAIPDIRFISTHEGGGKAFKAWRLLRLNLFAFFTLWRMRKTITLVHAVDFDMVLPAWLFNRLTGTPYIYDIYDNYPDSRGITGWMRKPLDWMERFIIAHAARVILADESRTVQHSPIAPAKLLIVENVPDIDQASLPLSAQDSDRNRALRIGYLGTFEPRFRGLEDVITVVQDMPDVELHIAGIGALGPHIEGAAAACPRIHLYGPMEHRAGLAMLAECDIILGLYYSAVPNHRFAAPNKYFEHLLLGRPLLTSTGTPPGAKVVANDTGWAVDDHADAIKSVLEHALADPQSVQEKGTRAAAIWQHSFANYFDRAIAGDYVSAVRHCAKLPGAHR